MTRLRISPWLAPFTASVCLAQIPTVVSLPTPGITVAGAPVTIGAFVVPNPGTGNVVFLDGYRVLGTAPVALGQANVRTSILTGGKHTIKAVFRGNALYAPSESDDVQIIVQAAMPKSVAAVKEFEGTEASFIDMNSDGRVDLVRFTGSLAVVELMQENGTYGVATPYDIGSGRVPLGVADFNGDWIVDIAAADNGKLVVVAGNATAGFTQNVLPGPQVTLESSVLPWVPFLTGDFNRDGAADIALIAYTFSVYSGPRLAIYFGNGSGGFTLASHSYDPKGAIGDANGDKILDFASDTWFRGTAYFYKTGCVLLVSLGSTYGNGGSCGATDVNNIRAGDINNDGKPDLVFDNFVRLGTGPGAFAAPVQVDFGATFVFTDLMDFNGDGNLDAIGISGNDLVVRFGNGAGAFPTFLILSAAGGAYKSIQDVNGDGVLDIVYRDRVRFGSARSAPTVESVTIPPMIQAGSEQTLVINLQDLDGASDLKTAIVNLALDTIKYCEITIDIASKTGSIVHFSQFAEGSGWKRSQYCAIDPQSITTVASGNTLTITLAMLLQYELQGSVQVSARAIDTLGADSGFKNSGMITVAHTNRSPEPVSVTVTGQNPRVFTVTMNDPDGLSNFATAELLIGDSATAANACYIAIDPQSRVVRLMTDSGAEWLGAYMITNRRMANSQCATSSGQFQYLSSSGNQLVFRVPVEILSFHGAKNLYLRAIDFSGGDSGFQAKGQIQLSSSGPAEPSVVDLQPRTGSGFNVSLTGQFQHPNGVNGHYLAYLLILPTPNVIQFTAQGSCLIEYNRISNGVRLINDAGTGWLGPESGVPISPAAGTLANSRCSVDVSKVVASISGEILTLTAPALLNMNMGPDLGTFIQSLDVTGKWTGMTQFGNWTVPNAPQIAPGPRFVSFSYTPVEPNTVNVGITFAHSQSLAKISLVHLRIASSISSNQYCHIIYSPALKAINLIDDTGTTLLGWRTVNTGALINSRCWAYTFDLAAGPSNGNAAVSFSVQRTPGNLPVDAKFYVNVFDVDGRLTHWVQAGTWP